jgi:hypothetical protein
LFSIPLPFGFLVPPVGLSLIFFIFLGQNHVRFRQSDVGEKMLFKHFAKFRSVLTVAFLNQLLAGSYTDLIDLKTNLSMIAKKE